MGLSLDEAGLAMPLGKGEVMVRVDLSSLVDLRFCRLLLGESCCESAMMCAV